MLSLNIGKRSLLYGVHQFLWHPLTVLLAWWHLYGRPNWNELVCIIIHDWGYWFSPNMDGPEGERHPEYAANLALRWFGQEYYELCLYHSRHYAKNAGVEPSKLCWADKYCLTYEPTWFYMIRALMSGELYEYRQKSATEGSVPLSATHFEWCRWLKNCLASQGIAQKCKVTLVRGNVTRFEPVEPIPDEEQHLKWPVGVRAL